MHVRDRLNYAIQDDELKELQLHISTEVLARDLSRGGSPDSVIIVPVGTPGRVLEAGGSWLRVSFSEDGTGVVFVTDQSEGDDGYWLATELEGGGYGKLRELPEKVLAVGDARYRLVHGAGAFLVVNPDDLEAIISRRRHLEGRTQ